MTSAQIAAAQFAHRRTFLQREIAERRLTAEQADARLRPWLHIAALAGAQVPGVSERGHTVFPWDKAGQPVDVPLVLSLTEADRTAARAELARARDAALDLADGLGADDPKVAYARRLALLAHDLGAPPCAHATAGGHATGAAS